MGKLDGLLAIQEEFNTNTGTGPVESKANESKMAIRIPAESKANESKMAIRIPAEEYVGSSTPRETKSNKKVSNLKIGLAIFGLGTFIVVAGNNWVHSGSYAKFHQEVSNWIDETGDKVIEAYLEKVSNSNRSY